jgi:uncharacterized membrane protein
VRATEQQIEAFETVSARALGLGVYVSSAFLAIGLALWLMTTGSWSTRVLDTGLLVLMATPAARVAVTLIECARARDWFFVATTTGVLFVLAAALVSALLSR